MCGLVGLIHNANNGFNTKDVTAFEEMLYVDALRGEDATGVACITTKQGAVILKEASHSAWFTYDKDYVTESKQFIQTGKALLGHNRKATIGGRKDENAHPFVFDDRYVFFHNGTLNNHKQLADTEVDSEALGMHLTKCNGDVEAIAELLERVKGAYACVWYDADKHTLYLLRNSERPLSVLHFENGTMAYASEAWIAAGPAQRNYLKVKEITHLLPHTLYSVDLKQMVPILQSETLPKKATPSITHTATVIGGITKQIVGLGKRQVKATLNHIKTNYVGFFIDDAQCSILDPNPAEVYQHIFSGTHDDYPGVIFKFTAEDLFPYEAEEMLGRYVSAIYDAHHFSKGNVLEVWVTKPVWKPSKPIQQAVH